jgi:hypothetical protein
MKALILELLIGVAVTSVVAYTIVVPIATETARSFERVSVVLEKGHLS